MTLKCLMHGGQFAIVGQLVSVPVDVNHRVTILPRDVFDDAAIETSTLETCKS